MSYIFQKRPYVHNRPHLIMGFSLHLCSVHGAASSAFSWKEFLRVMVYSIFTSQTHSRVQMSALCRKSARLEAKTTEGFLVLILPWDLGQTLTFGNPGFSLRKLGILPYLPLAQTGNMWQNIQCTVRQYKDIHIARMVIKPQTSKPSTTQLIFVCLLIQMVWEELK